MSTNPKPRRLGRSRLKQPLWVSVLMVVPILQSIACFSKAPTQSLLAVPRTPATPAISTNRSVGIISTPRKVRQGTSMIARHPTADVLNPLLWLGCHESGNLTSMGSGVAINVNGGDYLVTALHVIGNCNLSPRVRFNGQWNAIDWRTLAIDKDNDIVVLKNRNNFGSSRDSSAIWRAGWANIRSDRVRSRISRLLCRRVEHRSYNGGGRQARSDRIASSRQFYVHGKRNIQRIIHQRRVFRRSDSFSSRRGPMDYCGDNYSLPYR